MLRNIEKDIGIIDCDLNASDHLISNSLTLGESLEIREVFFNEPKDHHDAVMQRSIDMKRNPLSFDIHYITPEVDHDLNVQQHVIGDISEAVDNNISLQHCPENNALLKLWNVTASEFLLIPCQLEGLKSSAIVNECDNTSASASTNLESQKTKIYRCDICNENSDELSSALLHYERVHQLFKCPFCVKHFTRSYQLKLHLVVHSDRREFVCTVCRKQFKRNRDLKQHVKRQHTVQAFNTETFLCDSCGFQSKSKNSIRSHVLGHLGVASFVCNVCSKPCRNKVDLMDHCNTHFNIKSHQCDVCKVYFTRREVMIKHRRTQHEGLYSFVCDVCGRSFLHKTSLKIHLKLHTGENQVECDLCGKKMSGKIALMNHKKIHNQQRDFVCGICGRTYINKCSLQEHLLVHTGSNPFQCLQCDNSFFSRKKLLMHERIHDPQRTLYKCFSCEKSYTSKFRLRQHYNKHHLQEKLSM